MSPELSIPKLSIIVVQRGDTARLHELLIACPEDPRFELLVVDQQGVCGDFGQRCRVLEPESNLGFAGGVNLGVKEASAPLILLLNPDARPQPAALEALLVGFERYPNVAGLVPALVYPDGSAQCDWQLRPLPRAIDLLAQTWFLDLPRGPVLEPEAGTRIEQPAAAALALRRSCLQELGGLDSTFYPAWFEDVDLARRAKDTGMEFRYWPTARFVHAVGSTLPALGYRTFLWLYYRNLLRYARKHHGRPTTAALRASLVLSPVLRLLALPVRAARRATSRGAAARAHLSLAQGALTGFRVPAALRESWCPPPPTSNHGSHA
jgi:GT2 family glycosyltransferase